MDTQKAIDAFSHFSNQEKSEFLAHLSHELTILARAAYVPGTEDLNDPARLRRINELQHQLSGFLMKLLSNDVERYPDDVFVRILVERSGGGELQNEVQNVFSRLVDRSAVSI
jgi:hypothetical protein